MFEEGFTEHEYPEVELSKEGSPYALQLGSGGIGASDGSLAVTQDARQLRMTADLGDDKLELRIDNAQPRRGEIKYADAETAMHLMAHIVCP